MYAIEAMGLMKAAHKGPLGSNSANKVGCSPPRALRGDRMSSVDSCSPTGGKKHGSVLIIHGNQRTAKFLDGVLRSGFTVRTSTDSSEAIEHLREEPPDAILCDLDCLEEDSGDLFDVLGNDVGLLEIPLILIMRERSEDFPHTRKLLSKASDCVSPSIAPSLLKWKIMKLISLKRELACLRTSELEARKRADRFESLAQMAAHDLKSPIIAVNGFLRRLKTRLEETSVIQDTKQILDKVSSSCQFVEDFLSEMHELLASYRVSTKRKPIRLDEIASEVMEQYRALSEKNEVDIRLYAEKSLPRAIGNPSRIKQVFDNLLTNALRHMGNVPNPVISITIAQRGKLVVTSVSDNGVGIPPEWRETIFDPFIRGPHAVDRSGSGLGLSIVKQIVNRHNGEIWVDTRSGHGTTFIFTLPTSSAAA